MTAHPTTSTNPGLDAGPNPAREVGTDPGAVTLTAKQVVGQSLARGPLAAALLHVERAWTNTEGWGTADEHIQQVAAGPIDAADHAGLYYGAPAIAFLLHTAQDRHPRYRAAADTLDEHVQRTARRRVATALSRIERHEHATFAEYDLFYGLTGIGALLLRHHPRSEALAAILRYLVRLTQPRRHDGIDLPGWWVRHDPDEIVPTPGGHANFGMAHGAAGLLAVLALATRRGCVVEGQHQAIAVLTDWFDRWRQDSPNGPWWPQWITQAELRRGRPAPAGPGRPSWCYGTVGIARAQQLAALATADRARQQAAERALAASLTDIQLDRITEPGVCHGLAGIYQTTYRAAQDAHDDLLAPRLRALGDHLLQHASERGDHVDGGGLLTGDAGIGLALHTLRRTAPPHTGWDACLLIT